MGRDEIGVQNGGESVIGKMQKGTQKPHNQPAFLAHPWVLYHTEVHLNGTS